MNIAFNMNFLLVIAGGAAGALLRYLVVISLTSARNPGSTWATLTVNLLGSLLIGILARVAEISEFSQEMKSLVFFGLLGSFTTFSTFSNETFQYLKSQQYMLAGLHVLYHNILGVGMVMAGYFLTSKVSAGEAPGLD